MYSKDRYFHSVAYNMVRVVNRLAQLVQEEGGTTEPHRCPMDIHTVGFNERIGRLEEKISTIKRFGKEKEKLAALKAEHAQLVEAMDKAPVIRTEYVSLICDLWIRFTLDGYRYCFSVETNPFFPDSWNKMPDGQEGQYFTEQIESGKKFYYPDDMFQPVAKEETIERSAREILAFLKRQKACKRYA